MIIDWNLWATLIIAILSADLIKFTWITILTPKPKI